MFVHDKYYNVADAVNHNLVLVNSHADPFPGVNVFGDCFFNLVNIVKAFRPYQAEEYPPPISKSEAMASSKSRLLTPK